MNSIQIETTLLSSLREKQHLEAAESILSPKRLLPETKLLLAAYKKYFTSHPEHSEVDFQLFYTHFANEWHPELDDTQLTYYKDFVFPAILEAPKETVDSLRESFTKLQCQGELEKLSGSEFDINKLQRISEKYSKMLEARIVDDEAYTIDTVDFSTLDKAFGVPWFLDKLQNSLGSIVKGQFIVVSGDVGTGKSAFCISQAVTGFLHANKSNELGPVMYFNSEGTAADVFGRFLSCLYRKHVHGGFEEVVVRHKEVVDKFKHSFDARKLILFQMATIKNIEHLRDKVLQHKPSLVLIDICDKLASEEDPQSLKKLYDNLRLLAGEACPVIGTSQSNNTEYTDQESGESKNRKWLGDKALHGSRQGKSGAADTIITIGKENVTSLMRYISVPKKKRGEQTQLVCELQEKFSYYREVEE